MAMLLKCTLCGRRRRVARGERKRALFYAELEARDWRREFDLVRDKQDKDLAEKFCAAYERTMTELIEKEVADG